MAASLLDKSVVFDALRSENALHGPSVHHTHSVDKMFRQVVRDLCERRETLIMAPTSGITHLLEVVDVQIERPFCATGGGFYDAIDPESAALTRNTYSNPVIVDVLQTVYEPMDRTTAVHTDGKDAAAIDADIQEVERALAERLPVSAAARGGSYVVPGERQQSRRMTAAAAVAHQQAATGAVLGDVADAAAAARPRINLNPDQSGSRVTQTLYREVLKFFVPTMVGSAMCKTREEAPLGPNDPFLVPGQYIAKGTHKVMLLQRKLHNNRLYVMRASDQAWTWRAEIRAVNSYKLRSTSTLVVHVKCDGNGTGPLRGCVRMPYVPGDLPVLAVALVLGFRSAEEVAVAAATDGVLAGLGAIPAHHPVYDTPAVRETYQWVLSLLRDQLPKNCPDLEAMPRSRLLAWLGERGGDKHAHGSDAPLNAVHVTASELLPNSGLAADVWTVGRKGVEFACCLRTLADVCRELTPADDIDHAGNRSYDTNGVMFAALLRQLNRRAMKQVKFDAREKAKSGRYVNVPEIMHSKRATDNQVYGITSGNWGVNKGGSTQTGVTQMTNHANVVATWSHVRRADHNLKRESNQPKPRLVHPSSFGLICPAETPEGAACGLVEQLAQAVWLCQGHYTEHLLRWTAAALGGLLQAAPGPGVTTGACVRLRPTTSLRLSNRPKEQPPLEFPPDQLAALAAGRAEVRARVEAWGVRPATVLVGGVLLGYVRDLEEAAGVLRAARRAGRLPFDVAVEAHRPRHQLWVTGDAGGLRRPLFRLDWGHPSGNPLGGVADVAAAVLGLPVELFWAALRRAGVLEYLSKHEEENLLVLGSPCDPEALRGAAGPLEAFTHCEVHPSLALGTTAASLAFSPNNQACRNTYFTANKKQVAAAMPPVPQGTSSMVAWYPQRTQVTTWSETIRGFPPCSVNLRVGVLAYGGLNQEDSIILNADTVAQGALNVSMLHTFTEDCQPGGPSGEVQRFCMPTPDTLGLNMGASRGVASTCGPLDAYRRLREDGVVAPRTLLQPGDAIIGTTGVVQGGGQRDRSLILSARHGPQIVDDVFWVQGRDGRGVVTVRCHAPRTLQDGDKLTSSHGQKGVQGTQLPARDMPVTDDGMVLDLVVNPHAHPSRMTPGNHKEALVAFLCGLLGVSVEATPFNDVPIGEVMEALKAAGASPLCQRVMYQGSTGRRIAGSVFVGQVPIYRLKQMAKDKHHARALGPKAAIFRAAMEGAIREGGLRVGEMEKDCIQGYGAANVAKDRLHEQADPAFIPVCRECGEVGINAAPPGLDRAASTTNRTGPYCLHCKRSGTTVRVAMPYASKVLVSEMQAMAIRTRLELEEEPHVNPYAACAVSMQRDVERERALCGLTVQDPPKFRGMPYPSSAATLWPEEDLHPHDRHAKQPRLRQSAP